MKFTIFSFRIRKRVGFYCVLRDWGDFSDFCVRDYLRFAIEWNFRATGHMYLFKFESVQQTSCPSAADNVRCQVWSDYRIINKAKNGGDTLLFRRKPTSK